MTETSHNDSIAMHTSTAKQRLAKGRAAEASKGPPLVSQIVLGDWLKVRTRLVSIPDGHYHHIEVEKVNQSRAMTAAGWRRTAGTARREHHLRARHIKRAQS